MGTAGPPGPSLQGSTSQQPINDQLFCAIQVRLWYRDGLLEGE